MTKQMVAGQPVPRFDSRTMAAVSSGSRAIARLFSGLRLGSVGGGSLPGSISALLGRTRGGTVDAMGNVIATSRSSSGGTADPPVWTGKALSSADIARAAHLVLGVIAAHALGVTHNDLHADNVLIGDDGLPRIIDWENAVAEDLADSIDPFADRTIDSIEAVVVPDVVYDEVPYDARFFTALQDSVIPVLFGNTWVRDRRVHIARDWTWVGYIFAWTWPEAARFADDPHSAPTSPSAPPPLCETDTSVPVSVASKSVISKAPPAPLRTEAKGRAGLAVEGVPAKAKGRAALAVEGVAAKAKGRAGGAIEGVAAAKGRAGGAIEGVAAVGGEATDGKAGAAISGGLKEAGEAEDLSAAAERRVLERSYNRSMHQAIELLRRGSDEDARLAWFILRNAADSASVEVRLRRPPLPD